MDPYKELGIGADASSEEIKSAYRKLAKRYHPDANPDSSYASDKMNRINAAYAMLRDGADDLDLSEDWYRKKAEDTGEGRYSIFYHPVFRRVVLIGIAVSMAAVGIVSAFSSALFAH